MTENRREYVFEFDEDEPVLPVTLEMSRNEKQIDVLALWDTGASVTVISKKIVDELGLQPLKDNELIMSGGTISTKMYKIDLNLPGGVKFRDLMASNGLTDDFEYDALIGMDVIRNCNFCYSNDGKVQRLKYSFDSDLYTIRYK